jgi:MFS family permease
VARAALGITEAGYFPAAIKTVAEWFPKKERAFATGICYVFYLRFCLYQRLVFNEADCS